MSEFLPFHRQWLGECLAPGTWRQTDTSDTYQALCSQVVPNAAKPRPAYVQCKQSSDSILVYFILHQPHQSHCPSIGCAAAPLAWAVATDQKTCSLKVKWPS